MKPNDLVTLLTKCAKLGEPVLVSGMPGIGKSAIATKVAQETGMELIISHPVLEDPTNYKGFPWICDGKAEWIPFGDLRRLMEAKEPTIWLIDDVGQAPLSVQAALMQLVHRDSRAINGNKISPKVTIIACTNRRADKAGVTGFVEPLKSRFITHVELEADIKEWQEWALTEGNIELAIVSYLRYRPELFCKPDPNNDLKGWPSPRTWEHVSRLVKAKLPSRILREAMIGTVGEAAAVDFGNFLKVFDELPDIDEIIANPEKTRLPGNAMTKYACIGALCGALNVDNAGQILKYVDRLDPEFGTLFAVFLKTRSPHLMETAAYIDWTLRHQKEWGLNGN